MKFIIMHIIIILESWSIWSLIMLFLNIYFYARLKGYTFFIIL